MKLVLDANVAAKLYLSEPDSDKAHQLLSKAVEEDMELHAPDLIVHELGNALWRSHISSGRMLRCLLRFLELGITIHAFSGQNTRLLKDCCRLSKSLGITFYDASYLALALRLDSRLVTLDESILRRSDIALDLDQALDVMAERSR